MNKRNRICENRLWVSYQLNKKRIRALLVIAILSGMLTVFAQGTKEARVFSVRDFGAKGDNKTLDTKAIQKALDECGKAGGGIVRIPKGTYLSGSIFIKSRTTLRIEKGAILEGSKKLDDYPIRPSFRLGGTEQKSHSSLVSAIGAQDITITGEGLISGSGLRRSKKSSASSPRVIQIVGCKNVLLENFTVTNQARWTIHPLYCTNFTARNLRVLVTAGGRNGDGLNPESCTNVLITDCTFKTKDDCIAIKSGKNQQGVDIGIPCQNVTVTKCTMLRGYGAVCIGSDMSGGIRNIVIKDCVFKDVDRGIDIKTRKGRGGIVENVFVSNIQTFDLGSPIVIRMDYPWNTGNLIQGEAGIPIIRNITFKDIKIHGKGIREVKEKGKIKRMGIGMGRICGMEESPIQGVTLKNIIAEGNAQLRMEHVTGLVIDNVRNSKSDKAIGMKDVKLQE